jgi:hypothetical protein
MTAALAMPAAAAQSWGAGAFKGPAPAVEQVKMKKKYAKKHSFKRHGSYAYYNGYRGYNHPYPGYRYHNGYWFPPIAFLAAIIGGAILLSH